MGILNDKFILPFFLLSLFISIKGGMLKNM
ncbi:unnamed protein product [Amaranthus hypochondriacus]